ncbi:hypothetical protein CHLRE_02g114100v5 [Chlamydomonas reinhardtii]|uniref:PDEase domain-containing protein n=1 Tax=Chlamydomonas reinhardtii TaxID=3055 RepID=A0A2K3E354_CHLRE|nr:uncharacterized protein CHLRE_02g114100v5 [Chlamydomonas reinhardtii]PNW87229.1 hypothetical protein CHLRE_02g114100v5 [Chlamydomonas reinhardtii]
MQTLGKVIRVYPSTVIAPLLVTACMLGLGLSGMQLASNFYAKSSQVEATEVAVVAAAALQQRVAAALAPLQLLSAVAQVAPQYEAAAAWFGLLVPVLAAQLPRPQLPEGSLRQLLLAPAGVVRQAHTPAAATPAAATPGAAGADANTSTGGGSSSDTPTPAGGWPVGTDLLNGSVLGASQRHCGALAAVAARNQTVSSTCDLPVTSAGVGGATALTAYHAVFVPQQRISASGNSSSSSSSSMSAAAAVAAAAAAAWGRPDAVNTACGAPCQDDVDTGLQFWGVVGAVLDIPLLLARVPGSPLAAVTDSGYSYRLEDDANTVIASAGGSGTAFTTASVTVSAPVTLPGGSGPGWTLYVAPAGGGGWGPAWRGGYTAAVVLVAVGLGLMVFLLLVARRKQELILRALLPKEILHDLSAANSVTSLGRATLGGDTPAALILGLIQGLVTGQRLPDLRHVLLIRTALLRGVDVYQPLDLRNRIKDSGLAADVTQALLRQLGAFPGAGGIMDGSSGALVGGAGGPGPGGGGGAAASQPQYYYLPHVASSNGRVGGGGFMLATGGSTAPDTYVAAAYASGGGAVGDGSFGDVSRFGGWPSGGGGPNRRPPRRGSSKALFAQAAGTAASAGAAAAAAAPPPDLDTLTGALTFLLTPPPPQPLPPPPPAMLAPAGPAPASANLFSALPAGLGGAPAAVDSPGTMTAAGGVTAVASANHRRGASTAGVIGCGSGNFSAFRESFGGGPTVASRLGAPAADAGSFGSVSLGGGGPLLCVRGNHASSIGSTAAMAATFGNNSAFYWSGAATPRASVDATGASSPLPSSLGPMPSKLRASQWLSGTCGAGNSPSAAAATAAAGALPASSATAQPFQRAATATGMPTAGSNVATDIATTLTTAAASPVPSLLLSAAALPSDPTSNTTTVDGGGGTGGGYEFGGGRGSCDMPATTAAVAAPAAVAGVGAVADGDVLIDMLALAAGGSCGVAAGAASGGGATSGGILVGSPPGTGSVNLDNAFISAFSTTAALSGGAGGGGGGGGGGAPAALSPGGAGGSVGVMAGAAAASSGTGGLGGFVGLTIGDRPLVRRPPTASPSGGLGSFGSRSLTPVLRQFRELRRRASSRFLDGPSGGVGSAAAASALSTATAAATAAALASSSAGGSNTPFGHLQAMHSHSEALGTVAPASAAQVQLAPFLSHQLSPYQTVGPRQLESLVEDGCMASGDAARLAGSAAAVSAAAAAAAVAAPCDGGGRRNSLASRVTPLSSPLSMTAPSAVAYTPLDTRCIHRSAATPASSSITSAVLSSGVLPVSASTPGPTHAPSPSHGPLPHLPPLAVASRSLLYQPPSQQVSSSRLPSSQPQTPLSPTRQLTSPPPAQGALSAAAELLLTSCTGGGSRRHGGGGGGDCGGGMAAPPSPPPLLDASALAGLVVLPAAASVDMAVEVGAPAAGGGVAWAPASAVPRVRASVDMGVAAAALASSPWASGALLPSGALERACLLSRQLQPPPQLRLTQLQQQQQQQQQPPQQQQQQPPPPQPPPPPVIEEVERLLAGADAWQFDTWRLAEATSGHALSCLGFYLLQREGLIAHFRIRPHRLARLLRALEDGYRADNPYHSATHAADVLQTLHVIIHGAQLHVHYLDKLGLLAAYVAAVVHDHGHPGLTNDFLIATHDPLAVRYNDRSPLENHHAASAFEQLLQPGHDITTGMEPSDRAAFRKQVIDMVLATDMKQHFAILSHFNTVHRLQAYKPNSGGEGGGGTGGGPAAATGTGGGAAAPATAERPTGLRRAFTGELKDKGSSAGTASGGTLSGANGVASGGISGAFSGALSGAVSLAAGFVNNSSKGSVAAATALLQADAAPPRPLDDSERMLTMQLALKVADIGHLGEDLEVHCKWLSGLEEEFFRQGDKEKELGLPISPLFDRAKQGVSKSQGGFFEFVALPLTHALTTAFPNASPIMDCFVANYEHWKKVEAATAQQAAGAKEQQVTPKERDATQQQQ